MGMDVKIVKPLEPGYVQVDTASKDGYIRHYKVPKKGAKTFSKSIKEQEKTLNIYSNLTFFSSIFIGVLGASAFTKKVDSKITQFLIQTSAAIGLSILTSLGFEKYAQNKQQDLLKRYNAREIFYKA